MTPTMAFWGGPIGMYTSEGDVLDVQLTGRQPQVSANPNPALVQQVVHYGHGVGVGTGGTPRSGTAIAWKPSYFMFLGAITPGDSGSGANKLTGDRLGDNREAAGIMTALWIDSRLRKGVAMMAATRATQVKAPLANGVTRPELAPGEVAPDVDPRPQFYFDWARGRNRGQRPQPACGHLAHRVPVRARLRGR